MVKYLLLLAALFPAFAMENNGWLQPKTHNYSFIFPITHIRKSSTKYYEDCYEAILSNGSVIVAAIRSDLTFDCFKKKYSSKGMERIPLSPLDFVILKELYEKVYQEYINDLQQDKLTGIALGMTLMLSRSQKH